MVWNPMMDALQGATMVSGLQDRAEIRKLRQSQEARATEAHGLNMEDGRQRMVAFKEERDYLLVSRKLEGLVAQHVDSRTGEVKPTVLDALRKNPRFAAVIREAEAEGGFELGSIKSPGAFLGLVASKAPELWGKLQGDFRQAEGQRAAGGLMRKGVEMAFGGQGGSVPVPGAAPQGPQAPPEPEVVTAAAEEPVVEEPMAEPAAYTVNEHGGMSRDLTFAEARMPGVRPDPRAGLVEASGTMANRQRGGFRPERAAPEPSGPVVTRGQRRRQERAGLAAVVETPETPAAERGSQDAVSANGVPNAPLSEWTDEQRAMIGLPPADEQPEQEGPKSDLGAALGNFQAHPGNRAAEREFMLEMADAVTEGYLTPAEANIIKGMFAKAEGKPGTFTWKDVRDENGNVIAQIPLYANPHTMQTGSGPAIQTGVPGAMSPAARQQAEQRASVEVRAQLAHDTAVAKLAFPGEEKYVGKARANLVGAMQIARSVGMGGDGTTDVAEALGMQQALGSQVGARFMGVGSKDAGRSWNEVPPQRMFNAMLGMYASFATEKEYNQKIVNPIQAQWRKPEFNGLNQTQAITSLTEMRARLLGLGKRSAKEIDAVIADTITRNPVALELMSRPDPVLRQRGMLMALPADWHQ